MAGHVERPKVLVTRSDYLQFHGEILKQHFEVESWDNAKNGTLQRGKLIELIRGRFAVFTGPDIIFDEEVIAAGAPTLMVISTFSAGVDHIDLEALKKHKVRLGHCPNVNVEATAELTVGLLLATSRRIVEASIAVKNGRWKCNHLVHQWLLGQGIHDSTVGIIGYGRVGHSVAVKLKSFSPKRILYTSRTEKAIGAEIGAVFTDLDTLLRSSDFVVLTIAATNETRGIINRSKIALMKKNAIFVNTSRGALVDQDALLEALQQKNILGAGLDVMNPEPIPLNHPLLNVENCVILPHIGYSSSKAVNEMYQISIDNIIAVWKGVRMPAEYVL